MKNNYQIQAIPVHTLSEHPANKEYHSDLTTSEYELLSQDIQNHGLRNPILINKDMVILSGNWRWKVCKELGHEYIDTKLVDCSPDEELELLVLENKTRRGSEGDLIKLAKQIKLIYEKWKISPGRKSVHNAQNKNRLDVAKAFGMNETKVRRHLQLLNLNEDLQALVSKEVITLMGGVALSVHPPEIQSKFYNYISELGFPSLTVKYIKSIIETFNDLNGNVAEETMHEANTNEVINKEDKEVKKVKNAVSQILLLKLNRGSKYQLKALFIHAIKNLEEMID